MRKIVFALLAIVPLMVHGGALFTAESRNVATGEIEKFQIGVQDGNVFMVTYGADTNSSSMQTMNEASGVAASARIQSDTSKKRDEVVFNHGLQTAWFDDGNGRVQKMNRDEITKMTGGRTSVGDSQNMKSAMSQYEAAMKQAQKEIANLDPKQQEQLKELGIFGGNEPQSHNPGIQTTYRDNGKQETVGRFRTRGVDEYEDERLVAHHSVVDWSDIPYSGEFRDAFDNLDAFYTSLIDAAGGKMSRDHLMSTPGAVFTGAGGMPVKTEEVGDDGVERVLILQDIEEHHFPDGAFIR